MFQRLRGPGITLNVKMFDTFFQIIQHDKQIVIPSNKQRSPRCRPSFTRTATNRTRRQRIPLSVGAPLLRFNHA